MSATELAVLMRAHALFSGEPGDPPLASGHSPAPPAPGLAGLAATRYRDSAAISRSEVEAAREVDTEFDRILAAARRTHSDARRDTAAVLAAARDDAQIPVGNPLAARELLRRRVARLRAQQAHVLAARRRAHRGRTYLRALHYRSAHRPGAGRDVRAEAAVRAALSRLGRPYVWGATGPDRFDCSGLVQWAYAQAGVPLHRTTYQQIHDGVPVSPSQVRPGDLVFPHTGHVQLAIGDNLVVEAPQPGATVQISRMGPSIAIRRPVWG